MYNDIELNDPGMQTWVTVTFDTPSRRLFYKSIKNGRHCKSFSSLDFKCRENPVFFLIVLVFGHLK